MTIINLASNNPGTVDGRDDFTSTYDLASGDTNFDIQVSEYGSFHLHIITGQFNYPLLTTLGTNLTGVLDATIELQESADGINFGSATPQLIQTLNSANDLSLGWKTKVVQMPYLRVKLVVNGVTGGTIRPIITLKPN